MAKTIIIGGSFDPIQRGHLALIAACAELKDVERIIIMPAQISPFKTQQQSRLGLYRYALLEAALADLVNLAVVIPEISQSSRLKCKKLYESKRLFVSDLEILREGPSYTYQTVLALEEQYPHTELCLAAGTDILLDLDKWYEVETLLKKVSLIIAARPLVSNQTHQAEELTNLIAATKAKYGCPIYRLTAEMPLISSTELRMHLEKLPLKDIYKLNIDKQQPLAQVADYGEYANKLANLLLKATNLDSNARKLLLLNLTPQVLTLCLQFALYQQPDLKKIFTQSQLEFIKTLARYLHKNLPIKRALHCYNVMYFAVALALKYVNAYVEEYFEAGKLNVAGQTLCYQAAVAGLFHDAAKYADINDYPTVKAQLSEADIKIYKIEHGPIAAAILKENFNCQDQMILEAIFYHTTLRPGASLVDKFVYIADKLEFGRTYADAPNLRAELKNGYDCVIALILEKTLSLLANKQLQPHPLSLAAYQDIKHRL